MALNRWHCMDCGKDTDAAQEYFALQDDLWRRIVRRPHRTGMLCLACVERRLGRSLNRADFKPVPVNDRQAQVCTALATRLAMPPADPRVTTNWRARRAQFKSVQALRIAKQWRGK